MIAPVTAGITASTVVSSRLQAGDRTAVLAGCCLTALLVAPVPTMAAALFAFAVHRFRGAAARTRVDRRRSEECFEASELVALSLAGGMSIAAGHRAAMRHAAPLARAELAPLVDRMRVLGTTPALVGDDGRMQAGSRAIAAAATSGAAALPALEAYLEVEAHRRHTQEVERVRRLPIRLMLPLTLLVLPGFVVMTVGPTIVESLARLTP